eukprot:TRINITY_DN342_c0_g1_i3.p1 TRINITY_DN342_c0_g1~~TRINITY_DN342_c0_g1_i3.p1  ORF type:complete len:126 (-),score=10.20 TRINITY_DN342_c0_g1_i3:275-652(-)
MINSLDNISKSISPNIFVIMSAKIHNGGDVLYEGVHETILCDHSVYIGRHSEPPNHQSNNIQSNIVHNFDDNAPQMGSTSHLNDDLSTEDHQYQNININFNKNINKNNGITPILTIQPTILQLRK